MPKQGASKLVPFLPRTIKFFALSRIWPSADALQMSLLCNERSSQRFWNRHRDERGPGLT